MPPSIHPAEEVRAWVAAGTWRATRSGSRRPAARLVGYARLRRRLAGRPLRRPAVQGTGVGSLLLDVAKAQRPDGFCLWVFESNTPARALLRPAGPASSSSAPTARATRSSAPDIRMAWPGADPLAFYRGLIDDVDAELGDLLDRRVALTRAIQPHKGPPSGTSSGSGRSPGDGRPARPSLGDGAADPDRARDHHREPRCRLHRWLRRAFCARLETTAAWAGSRPRGHLDRLDERCASEPDRHTDCRRRLHRWLRRAFCARLETTAAWAGSRPRGHLDRLDERWLRPSPTDTRTVGAASTDG